MSKNKTLEWESKAVSHVGTVRKVNEDSCLDKSSNGLWVVADGMGGHAAGDVASKSIVDALNLINTEGGLADLADKVEACLIQVNADLVRMAQETDKMTIGSTVVVLCMRDKHALCVWAGDSRIYRLRKGKLEQLTQDHAMVEDMVDVGLITREEAENHPQANRITRAIGASDDLFVDMDIFELNHGDVFLMCSDGLYKEVGEQDIQKLMKRNGNPAKAAVDLALERGARDNVTVVTVKVVAN